MVQIAKTAFPESIKRIFDFDNCEIHSFGNVHKLCEKDTPIMLLIPKSCIFSIHFLPDENFVQIQTGNLAFNHYAAIKEMEKLGLIN